MAQRGGSSEQLAPPDPGAGLLGGCAAPAMQLHFKPNGDVLPCCWSIRPLGNIRDQRLSEIWDGVVHRDLIARLDRLDFSAGCQGCAAEVELEGRPGSHLAYFDDWQASIGPPWPPAGEAFPTPRRFEFELSNACNLQCVQCSGEYSSAIRIHREKRPPLPKVYDDAFFEDVERFLPGLVEASFAGGEPFMAAENFRIWEAMARVAPHVPVTITTNGTYWNEKVERVLHTLPVDIIVSIDGITPGVYESIREGSSLATVLANLERFREAARPGGRSVQINVCMMPTNLTEIPDLLRFAEERGIVANLIAVRGPAHASLTALPPAELGELVRTVEGRDAELQAALERNLPMWDTTLAQLRVWSAQGDESGVTVRSATNPQLMGFPRDGVGPTDDRAALEDLRRAVDGEPVWAIDIDDNDRMVTFPEGLADRLGVVAADLVGAHPSALLGLVRRWEPLTETPDRVDAVVRFEAGTAHCRIVALRDETGRCHSARTLVAFPRS